MAAPITESQPTSSPSSFLDVEKKAEQDISQASSITGIEATTEVSPREVHGWKWALVVISILSSIFLFSLDNTIVADIQPAIITDFGEINKLPWLTSAFLIAAASLNLVWGKVFTVFEAKWTYIICVIIFEIGSAVCGAAPNMNALIIGRAICGIGGSGMYIGVMTLLSVTTTIQERPLYVGSTGLMWGIGTVLGPIIGGAFTESSAGWRWAFYINLCVGGLFAPIYIFMLPTSDPKPNTTLRNRVRELDWVGGILLVGAFITFIMAVSFGGILYAWNSGQIIACFVLAFVLFGVFAIQQEKAIFTTPSRRIFPVQFMRSRTMLILFAQTSASACGIVVPLYMIPLFFQFAHGDGALEAGVRILPYIVLMVVACIVNGAVMSIYGLYMPWYLFGGILMTIGSALMYTVNINSSPAAVYGYTILIGFGTGAFCQASFAVAQAFVPAEEIPSAIGFISSGQIVGITISIAIANSVFLNGAETRIADILPNVPHDQIQAAIAGVGSKLVQTLPDALREKVLEAIVASISRIYILVITAGALCILLSLVMKRERLFMSPAVAA
jgi:MFS family permease